MCVLSLCCREDDEVTEARVSMKGQYKQRSSRSGRGSGGSGWSLDPLKGGCRISTHYPSLSEFPKLTHPGNFIF